MAVRRLNPYSNGLLSEIFFLIARCSDEES